MSDSLFKDSAPKTGASIFSSLAPAPQYSIGKLANDFRYRDTGWTIPQAYLALLFLAAEVDGKFDGEEAEVIKSVARRSPALRSLMRDGQLALHEEAALLEIQKDRANAFDKACETLSNEMVLSVFAHCIDLMLSDGEFHDTEKDFVDKLYRKLDISEEYARRILEVLLLKERY